MKIFRFTIFIFCLITIIFPIEISAETALDVYMNDFYSKSNEATQILKEIENSLKEGSRRKVCSKQREAARLGLLANKSLIKAFETEGIKPPIDVINSNKKRWESILNQC